MNAAEADEYQKIEQEVFHCCCFECFCFLTLSRHSVISCRGLEAIFMYLLSAVKGTGGRDEMPKSF